MFEEKDKNITITFGENLVENSCASTYKEIVDYNIESKKFEKISINLKSVKNIDFFGYQMLFYLSKYLLELLKNDENSLIIERSKEILKFEEKMGLKL